MSERSGAEPTTSETLRRLVVPVYLPIILGTIGTGMLIPVLPLYLTDRGISLGAASVVLGAVGIGSSLGSVPAGEMLGRFGERAAMLASFVVLALATAPIGLTDTVAVLIALRVAFGVASATLRLSRQTFVTRRIPAVRRGRALSFIGGSFRVALFVGPFLGGLLVDVVGYRSTFVISAAVGLVGLIPAAMSERAELSLLPEVRTAEQQSLGMIAGLRAHWRRLLIGGSVPVLVMMVREGRYIVLPLIADDLGMSATEVGAVVTVTTAADLVLFPAAGWLMDRYGRLHAMVPAFGLIVVGLIVLGLARSSGLVVVAGVLMGVGNGLGSGTMLTLGSDLAPADAAGPFLAGMALMQGLGRVGGALLVGAVGAWLGLGAAAMALGLVLVVAIAWLVGLIGDSSHPDRMRATVRRIIEDQAMAAR